MRKFAETHEWIDVQESKATLGISRFAREELGEIVYVELPEVGSFVQKGDEIAVLESTKAAVDIYAPVSGTIDELPSSQQEAIAKINADPENTGWLCRMTLSAFSELDGLYSEEEYVREVTATEER